jgi:hypothetical protein
MITNTSSNRSILNLEVNGVTELGDNGFKATVYVEKGSHPQLHEIRVIRGLKTQYRVYVGKWSEARTIGYETARDLHARYVRFSPAVVAPRRFANITTIGY